MTIFINCPETYYLAHIPERADFLDLERDAFSFNSTSIEMLSKSAIGGFNFYDNDDK